VDFIVEPQFEIAEDAFWIPSDSKQKYECFIEEIKGGPELRYLIGSHLRMSHQEYFCYFILCLRIPSSLFKFIS
jgi:hypothetical protein